MADDAQTSLQPKASQETLVSLLQLDPMPITADTDKELPPVPAEEDGVSEKAYTATTLAASTGSLSKSATTASAGSLGLTSSGHGAVYYLSRVQRYSSYAFAIFTSVHLVTTSLVPLATRSVESSESYLLLAREIYQTRLSEPLLVTVPIVAHVGAGIALRLVRRAQNLRRYGGPTPTLWPISRSGDAVASYRKPGDGGVSETADLAEFSPRPWWSPQSWLDGLRTLGARLATGWPPLSIISASGYAFAATLAGHVIVNRMLPLAVEGDSADIGLAYIAHGFARHPATSWLTYIFFLAVASGHMVWGWARWLTIAQRASWGGSLLGGVAGGPRSTGNAAADKAVQRRRRRTWLVIQTGAFVAFVAWAAGGLGVVARGGRMHGWVGDVYDGLYDVAGL